MRRSLTSKGMMERWPTSCQVWVSRCIGSGPAGRGRPTSASKPWPCVVTPDLPPDAVAFFDGSPQGLAICNAVFNAISDLGPISVRVSKSQIAIRRRHGFAFLWRHGRYVKSTAPVVLSLALPHELGSRRFKQVAHPAPQCGCIIWRFGIL